MGLVHPLLAFTFTDTRPADTVTTAVSALPPSDATMRAVPPATPVTSPVPLTVATAWSRLAQLKLPLLGELPSVVAAVAVSCTVPPTATVGVAGATLTDVTSPPPDPVPSPVQAASASARIAADSARFIGVPG
jgi:hypothetical protein